MAAQLSSLVKKIRSNALEEKRSLDDFDRVLGELGLFDAFSKTGSECLFGNIFNLRNHL